MHYVRQRTALTKRISLSNVCPARKIRYPLLHTLQNLPRPSRYLNAVYLVLCTRQLRSPTAESNTFFAQFELIRLSAVHCKTNFFHPDFLQTSPTFLIAMHNGTTTLSNRVSGIERLEDSRQTMLRHSRHPFGCSGRQHIVANNTTGRQGPQRQLCIIPLANYGRAAGP